MNELMIGEELTPCPEMFLAGVALLDVDPSGLSPQC